LKTAFKVLGFLSAIAVMFCAASANANTYTFSGNTSYNLGVLPAGNSSFSTTDTAFIAYPVGSNHTTSDNYDFTLLTDTLISVTFVSGSYTAPDFMNLCSASFCYASGTSNVSASLTAGDYALGVIALIPSQPDGTGALSTETYGADIVVGTNPTPLPSTWLMMLTGFVGLSFMAYRGNRNTARLVAA